MDAFTTSVKQKCGRISQTCKSEFAIVRHVEIQSTICPRLSLYLRVPKAIARP